jgi:hypothetical protein
MGRAALGPRAHPARRHPAGLNSCADVASRQALPTPWHCRRDLFTIGAPLRCRRPMYINRILLLTLVILYAFTPVMADWIDASDAQWYRAHLLWLAIIACVSVLTSRESRDGN